MLHFFDGFCLPLYKCGPLWYNTAAGGECRAPKEGAAGSLPRRRPWEKEGVVMGRETAGKTIAQNRKAFHDYFVEERFEAGISLAGTEVKSIRAGKVNLKDCFCTVEDGQLVVIGMHISPYEQGNIFNKDPLRKRVLLMHKKEIMRLFGKVKQEGMAIVPLSLYWKGPHVKVELGLCRGKRQHDKREAMAKRDAHREMDRAMKQANARR